MSGKTSQLHTEAAAEWAFSTFDVQQTVKWVAQKSVKALRSWEDADFTTMIHLHRLKSVSQPASQAINHTISYSISQSTTQSANQAFS